MPQIVFLSSCFLFLSLRLCFACFHLFHSAYFNIHLFYYLGFHSLLSNSPLINILQYVCLFSYLNHLWFWVGLLTMVLAVTDEAAIIVSQILCTSLFLMNTWKNSITKGWRNISPYKELSARGLANFGLPVKSICFLFNIWCGLWFGCWWWIWNGLSSDSYLFPLEDCWCRWLLTIWAFCFLFIGLSAVCNAL